MTRHWFRARNASTCSALAILFGALLLAPSVTAEAPSPAEATPRDMVGKIHMRYDISFWGIDFGYSALDTTFTQSSYRSVSKSETTGIITLLWKADIDVVSTGSFSSGALLPGNYDSYYAKSEGRKEQVALTFDAQGRPQLHADPPYDSKEFPVPDEKKTGTFDPLSAVVALISGAIWDSSHPCQFVAPVYDGRRRYDIGSSLEKAEQVAVDNGVYRGRAYQCKIEYQHVAGPKPKLIQEERGRYPTMHLYVADLPDRNAPSGHYFIVLEAWSDFGWGTMKLTLNSLAHGPGDKT